MKTFRYLVLFAALALTGFAGPREEIEALLHYLGNLEGASFIRNGDAHTPKEAESHLRMKWEKQESKITTAEDFIRRCATRSEVSGKPYIIRYQDSQEMESAVVLLKQLDVMRKVPATR
jgi:hypothetical protein